ncbi:TetR/AcrR family transcriptional regulator [Streptomyces odontomachi]|uniref:TetR/AcrR family transcriptional regulator n=1 Tax=Streptomyces odontomachi TaxID=2944940 RepID=UPI00210C1621|nr:TetR/AcrR family transcriptional regulator [Streptomyces sp. ODS25]
MAGSAGEPAGGSGPAAAASGRESSNSAEGRPAEGSGGRAGESTGEPEAPRPRRRAPAGAAVLRAEKTEAIRAAVFEELAAVGYARMSIEGIARRAGVGKTAVYRRWSSKLHLVLDLVSALAVQGLPTPDTGSLEGDLRQLYELTARALRHPVASQILPDLQAEAARNADMAEALQNALRAGQHSVASGIVRAAAARGELSADLDEDLALDLISGPLYWRAVVMRGKPPKGYLARLARATTAGLRTL